MYIQNTCQNLNHRGMACQAGDLDQSTTGALDITIYSILNVVKCVLLPRKTYPKALPLLMLQVYIYHVFDFQSLSR